MCKPSVTEAASVVTAARCDHAGCRQERVARQDRAAGRRIQRIGSRVVGRIAPLQLASFDVRKNGWPQLHAVADRDGIGMLERFVRT
jgi:hypothetical protein